MAEEFVRTAHFDAFSRRIDERIFGVENRMEQGFAHAANEREQILVAMNQRFDEVSRRFVWMLLLFSPMLVAMLGLVAALVQLVFAKS